MKEKKLKVLHVYAGRDWGGGETYVYDLVHRLQTAGHSVATISRPCCAVAGIAARGAVRNYEVPLRKNFSLRTFRSLARILKRESPDILHLHNFRLLPFVVARWLSGSRCRIVVTRHRIHRAQTDAFHRWLYRRITHFVFVSGKAAQAFLTDVPLPASRYSVIRNGVRPLPADARPSVDLRSRFGLQPSEPLIMYSGRLAAQKGIRTLLEAVALVRDIPFRLILVGCGTEKYEHEMHELTGQLRIADKVVFAGFSSEAALLTRQADLGVLPTIVPEAMPLTILEMMHAGRCALTTNNGGQVELLEHGRTGWLVPPDSPQALADALRYLLTHPDRCRQMGEAAHRKAAADFTYEHFFSRMVALYRKLTRDAYDATPDVPPKAASEPDK